MHNATTKQRLSALRRKLGMFARAPRWVRERRERLARLEATISEALGFRRPALARMASDTPTPILAAMPVVASSPTPPEGPSSSRWVTDGMILAPTGDVSRNTTQVVSTADIVRTAEIPMPEAAAQGISSSRLAVIAAAVIAALAGLVFVLRSGDGTPAQVERPRAAETPLLPAVRPAPPALAEPPAAPAPSAIRVRRGDTLWALARTHLGDPLRWPALHEANRGRIRDPDLIYPGQELGLPAR